MAKMVRGLTVPDAVELLRKTHKKSARLFEDVLRSAIANAEHNFKQDPQMMVLKTVVVNQGTHYRRGIPMARGRTRPIKKFLCHISINLGFATDAPIRPRPSPGAAKSKKADVSASKTTKTPVKTSGAKTKKSSVSSESSASSPSSK